MKCKSCGADYKLRDSECPYCGRENTLGKIWNVQEHTAQKKYEGVKKDVITNGIIYVINKILNAIIGVMIGIIILVMVILFISCYIGDGIEKRTKGKTSIEQLQSFYEEAEYNKLYEYMSEHGVLHEDTYTIYAEAAFMYKKWEKFVEQRMIFHNADLEDIEESPKYGLIYDCMKEASAIYMKEWSSSHREVAPENMAYYDWMCMEVDAFLIGELGMTYEEVMSLREIQSYEDEWKVLHRSLYDRNDWQWREDNE